MSATELSLEDHWRPYNMPTHSRTPDIVPSLVHRSLWRYIDSGDKSNWCTTANFCSQDFNRRYTRVVLYRSVTGYTVNKGKGLPWQAEVAQGVPGRLRPRIFLTFRHYKGGRSSAKGTGRLYPRRNPWYSLSEAESTSGHMVLSGVPRKKYRVTIPGIDPGTVRLVAQRHNHYGFIKDDFRKHHVL